MTTKGFKLCKFYSENLLWTDQPTDIATYRAAIAANNMTTTTTTTTATTVTTTTKTTMTTGGF